METHTHTHTQIQQQRGRRAAPRRPAARPRASPPARAPASSPPAPMQQQSSGGGMMAGLASTVAQGMAFGTGSAIAHRAVGAVAGSFSGGGDAERPAEYAQEQPMQAQPQQQFDMQNQACAGDKQMFFECLQQNKGDQQACTFLYDMLKQCQQQTHM